MRFCNLAAGLGALSFAFLACSSSEHRLGEGPGGAAATSGASGKGSSAGETSNGGDSGVAGRTSGGSGAGGGAAAGGAAAGSGTGGSSGTSNAAGDNAGGAPPIGGQPNVAGSSGTGGGGLESSCVQSGGTVTTQLCCGLTNDFPSQCPPSTACGCAPTSSHQIKVCDCPGTGACFDGHACVKP